jgi:hypothetical protein
MVPKDNGVAPQSLALEPMVLRRMADKMAVNELTVLDKKDRKTDSDARENLIRNIKQHAAELAGPSPSPVLKSLALTVALCEHDLRIRHAINGPQTYYDSGQRCLDRAERRYLAAVRMLATVQRMNLPNIQVNVARNQVVKNA